MHLELFAAKRRVPYEPDIWPGIDTYGPRGRVVSWVTANAGLFGSHRKPLRYCLQSGVAIHYTVTVRGELLVA